MQQNQTDQRQGSGTRRHSAGRSGVVCRTVLALVACALVAGCSAPSYKTSRNSEVDPKLGVRPSPRVIAKGDRIPDGGGRNMTGRPYVIAGRLYVPESDPARYSQVGLASWYGDDFHGRYTANGEIYNMSRLSAAHPTLPLPCYVRVTSMATGRSVVVRVNDRGPYHSNRIMDLSSAAAKMLGVDRLGVSKIKVDYVGRAPLAGNDMAYLKSTYRGPGAPANDGTDIAANIPVLGPVLGSVVDTFKPVVNSLVPGPVAPVAQQMADAGNGGLLPVPAPAVLPRERPYSVASVSSFPPVADPFDAYAGANAQRQYASFAGGQPLQGGASPVSSYPASQPAVSNYSAQGSIVFPEPRPVLPGEAPLAGPLDLAPSSSGPAPVRLERLKTGQDTSMAFPDSSNAQPAVAGLSPGPLRLSSQQ